MSMEFIEKLKESKIPVAPYFHRLCDLGWKYDLEESDLFIRLSKTLWTDGIKASLIFEEYCCVPPEGDTSRIRELIFYSFDKDQYPQRDIHSLFQEMQNEGDNSWQSAEEYIMHLEQNYPFYISNADFNTGIGHNDDGLLKVIDINDVPKKVLQNIIENLKNVSDL